MNSKRPCASVLTRRFARSSPDCARANDGGTRHLVARPVSRPGQVARRELSRAPTGTALAEAAALGSAAATLSLALGDEQRRGNKGDQQEGKKRRHDVGRWVFHREIMTPLAREWL